MSPTAITPDQFSTFGELLRHLRRQARITQRELAIAVGYSDTQISRIEQNQRVPDSATLTALFIPALYIEDEPKWVARLLELAKAAQVGGGITAEIPTGTVTFLFTDIEGSTKLAREYPETWEALLARHHAILQGAIESNHGFVFQVIGDAFCAAFHKAGDALHAAIEAQLALHKTSEVFAKHPRNEAEGAETSEVLTLRVRMGIHTGEAVAHENEYHGYLSLSLVQQLMSAGHGGQVLVSGATENLLRDQLPNEVTLRDFGKHNFKGVHQPVRIFQVVAPELQNDFPALRLFHILRNNLPAQLTSFIGRKQELEDIKKLLHEAHMLTLTGPGGTGKTRLSIQAAGEVLDQYPNGVWFVELAPIFDPLLVPRTTAIAIGLRDEPQRPVIDMLCDYLREKKMLIVLDNCEHLVDACAQMADRLLHAASELRILASSRETLGIAGEVTYQVPSLALPDLQDLPSIESLSQSEAVKLFIDRATAAVSTFTVTNDNAPALAQICHRLDGIPLAIELAAAKIRILSLDQIAKRLDDRFRLLIGGSRTALERHQTLRAAIDWSYNLLSPAEQTLFCRLSVFLNGWTLEAAESVCGDEISSSVVRSDDVLNLMEHLINKSLVIAEEMGHESRYRMLETIRQYALEKLWQAGEGNVIRQRHLAYFVDLAERAEPNLRARDMMIWLDRLEAEHDNSRAAMAWALESDIEAELRLAGALWWFWHIRGHKNEGIDWLERALSVEALERGEKPVWPARALIRGKALNVAGNLRLMLGKTDKGARLSEESLALLRDLGPAGKRGTAYALLNLGWVAYLQQDFDRGKALADESLALFREVRDKFGIAQCLDTLWDIVAWGESDYERARALCEEELALRKEMGDKDGIAWSLRKLGRAAFEQGDYGRATTMYAESQALFREVGNKWAMGVVLAGLGRVATVQGNYGQAAKWYEEALALERDAGDEFAIGTQWGVPYYLDAIAVLATAQRQMKRAARLFGASENVYHLIRFDQSPTMRAEHDQALAAARAALGEKAFAGAWAEGQAMMMEEAVAYALEEN